MECTELLGIVAASVRQCSEFVAGGKVHFQSRVVHEMEDKNYFGIQGGLQQSFKLNDRWNIFAEEYLRGYNGKITPSARTYTSGEYTFVLGASIGTSYRF